MSCHISLRRLIRASAALTLMTAATAHTATWSAVGTVGTVDDNDTALIDMVAGEARMRADAPVGSNIIVRYGVTQLSGFSGFKSMSWRMRFRDNGAGSQVKLSLRRLNRLTGLASTLETFDSNAEPVSLGYQAGFRCIGVTWDFENGPFFIEAELIRSGAGGQPALSMVQLTPEGCAP